MALNPVLKWYQAKPECEATLHYVVGLLWLGLEINKMIGILAWTGVYMQVKAWEVDRF